MLQSLALATVSLFLLVNCTGGKSPPSSGNQVVKEQAASGDQDVALTVQAGDDLKTRMPIKLRATAKGATSYTWEMVSGNPGFRFSETDVLDPTVAADMDGEYVLKITAASAGKEVSDTLKLTWDETAPSVYLTQDIKAYQEFTLQALISSPASVRWGQVSGPGDAQFSEPERDRTSFSAQVDGLYRIRITVADELGNEASQETTVLWDTSIPMVDAGPDLRVNGPVQLLALGSASDMNYVWSVSSGPGLDFSSRFVANPTVQAMQSGEYVLTVSATNRVGRSVKDELVVVWDMIPPSIGGLGPIHASKVVVLAPYVMDAASCEWSEISGPGSIVFGTPTAMASTVTASTDGTYMVKLSCVDEFGNAASENYTIHWDTEAPTIGSWPELPPSRTPVTLAPTTAGATEWSWGQVSGSGYVAFQQQSGSTVTVSADRSGTYVLQLRAFDDAGNMSSRDFSLQWDNQPPTIVMSDVYAPSLVTLMPMIGGASSYQWTQLSGPGLLVFNNAQIWNPEVTATVDGDYRLRISASDSAGNTAFTDINFHWDTTPPTVGTLSPILTHSTAYLEPEVIGAEFIQWTKISGPGTVTFSNHATAATTASFSADGDYVLQILVNDKVNHQIMRQFQVTKDSTGPTIGTMAAVTSSKPVLLNATVQDGVSYVWSKVSGPGTLVFDSPNQTSTLVQASSDGSYLIRLTAYDRLNNAATRDVNLIWDTTAPVIKPISDVQARGSVLVAATFNETSYLNWSKVSGPGSVYFRNLSDGVVNIDVNQDGEYILQLTATDLAGNASSIQFKLFSDSTPPQISIDSLDKALGKTVYFSAFIGGEYTTATWTTISGPGTASFSSNSALNPRVTVSELGSYKFRLTAVDSFGNTSSADLNVKFSGYETLPQNSVFYDELASPVLRDVHFQHYYSRVYAATAGGLSIRNNDGSYVNRTTRDGLLSNDTRRVFAYFDRVYVITGRGLSISSDRGVSFPVSAFVGSTVNSVFELNSAVYVGTPDGLYRSTNFGGSFTKIRSEPITSIYGWEGKLYALSSSGILISDNGVTNFVWKTFPYMGTDISVSTYNNFTRIFVSTSSGLAVSANDGESFTLRTTNQGLGTNALLRVAASGMYVYTASTAGLSISMDWGGNFTHATSSHGLGTTDVYGVSVMVTEVYVATRGGLSLSYNAGGTFTTENPSGSLGNQNITTARAVGNKLYVGTPAGLYISTNSGESFVRREFSAVSDIHINNDEVLLATSEGLQSSSLDGVNYSLNYSLPSGATGVFATGANIYATFYGNGLYMSNDGGRTWVQRTTAHGLDTQFLRDVVVADGKILVISDYGSLSISTDGGESFVSRTSLQLGGGSSLHSIHAEGAKVYLATSLGLLYSTDGGSTFSKIYNDSVKNVFAIGSNVYAATTRGLQRSLDSGVSFVLDTTTLGLGSNTVNGVWANGTDVYVATENGLAVYK